MRCVAIAVVIASCVATPSGEATSTESSSDGSESTPNLDSGPAEVPPMVDGCDQSVCGDGVIGIGEECDAPGKGTCSDDCVRPGFGDRYGTDAPIIGAAFDPDGGAIIVLGHPFSVLRVSADGQLLWTATPDGPDAAIPRTFEVALGDVILISGIDVVGPDYVGVRWHVGGDGTSSPGVLDLEGRPWIDATRTGVADMLVLIDGDGPGASRIERHDASGAVSWSWSHDADADPALSLRAIAEVASGVVIAAGHVAATGEPVIVRIEGDAPSTTHLLPELAHAQLYGVAPDGSGGVLLSGVTPDDAPIVGRVSSLGEIAWVTECVATGAFADVTLVDGRVVLYGRRYKPEICEDACAGETWAWVQQLDLEGTVLATDAPNGPLAVQAEASHELIVAVGRVPSGLRVAGTQQSGASMNEGFLLTVPW